jgi:hypothetical protein
VRSQVRALTNTGHDAVAQLIERHWGPAVVVHGTVFCPAGHPAGHWPGC